MSRAVIHARWVVPVSSPPIENARVVVEDGRVIQVERAGTSPAPTTDCGDAIILPGFINAHTHLELTACRGRVPYRGSFVDWIEDLTALNPHRNAGDLLDRSIRDGQEQSVSAGVTTVADIGIGPQVLAAWARASLNTVGFLEVLGMGAKGLTDHDRSIARASALCNGADERARRAARAEAHGSLIRRIGIAPHAPYSTEASVYRDAIEFATRTGRPICTHLAETRDEEHFLREGTGSFRRLLEDFDLWDGSFVPPGCGPVEYAHQLGLLACDPLLAHVNYATDADLDMIAGGNASVVYCPRAHRFFEHEPHRYRDMLARGINVCIGTDSLASNDSLSVLDELRFLRSQDATISNEALLAMGTIAGARALRIEAEVGSLERGKRADLVVVPLTHPHARDPIEDLLSSGSEPAAVYVGGRPIHAV